MRKNLPVSNWSQFDRRIRDKERKLLPMLSSFPDAVLVAGCQRSGTTVVTRILREALEMNCPTFTSDDELDAALILNGAIAFETEARCCFQTTYVNDHFLEYFEHDNYRLIWVIRRPEAVVRSMLFNWRRGALNRLFRASGRHALDDKGNERFARFGTFGFSRAEKACLSYNIKTAQVHDIAARLGPDRLFILDYDDLINQSDIVLGDIFSFAAVPYDARFLKSLRTPGGPGKERLNASTRDQIRNTCEHAYEQAVKLAQSWR